MLTDTRTISYTTAEGKIAESSDSQSGDGGAPYDGNIPAATEQEIDLAFAKAKVKSVLIYSRQAQITVRTNANHLGSPGDTIVVPAATTFVWNLNDPASNVNPFNGADVTKLYVTNDDATVATDIKIRVLLDVTP